MDDPLNRLPLLTSDDWKDVLDSWVRGELVNLCVEDIIQYLHPWLSPDRNPFPYITIIGGRRA